MDSQLQSALPVASNGSRARLVKKAPRGLLWVTYVLLLLMIGRVGEIVPGLAGLPLVKLVLIGVIGIVLVRWNQLPKMLVPGNKAIKWALAMTVWIGLSILFSIWPGPSRDFILFQLPILAVLVMAVCKSSVDWFAIRHLIYAVFVSAMILVVPGLLGFSGGRLTIDSLWSTDELAYVLVGIMPFAIAFGILARSKLWRYIYFGATLAMVLTIVLSGSRGGMLALPFVLGFIVWNPGKLKPADVAASKKKRRGNGTVARIVLILFACAIVGAVSWPLLPPETQSRVMSMFSLESDYNLSAQEGRLQIWSRGLQALANRPIGIGIDAFPMADMQYGGRFHTAHNSFILVLVELGPVGFVMYLALLLNLWRGLGSINKSLGMIETLSREQHQQAVFARILQASLLGNLIAGQFLSATYYYAHWVNIALAMAMIAVANRDEEPTSPARHRFS